MNNDRRCADTLSLEETLLEPRRFAAAHAPLFLVILIALAALLHVVTIGTGDLYSETEGQYAGAAREMIASRQLVAPNEQRHTAPAKTATALLGHHCFVQNSRRE